MSHCLPAHYCDILPQPPPLPMAAPGLLPPSVEQVSLSASSRLGSGLLPHTLCLFTTLANSFRLSCWYYGNQFPTHDPEQVMTLQHLTSMPSVVDGHDSVGHPAECRDFALFYPYQNR